jgi:hypothetical protein
MSQPTSPTPAQPVRCSGTDRFGYGTACARPAGHDGSHWLTSPASAERSFELRLERLAAEGR